MMDAILQHQGLIAHHFNGVLLSAGLIALFTLAEINWPAASLGATRGRVVNILIGLIVSASPSSARPRSLALQRGCGATA
jgi:hypothetical protein